MGTNGSLGMMCFLQQIKESCLDPHGRTIIYSHKPRRYWREICLDTARRRLFHSAPIITPPKSAC